MLFTNILHHLQRRSFAKGSQDSAQLFIKPLQLGFSVLPESNLELNLRSLADGRVALRGPGKVLLKGTVATDEFD